MTILRFLEKDVSSAIERKTVSRKRCRNSIENAWSESRLGGARSSSPGRTSQGKKRNHDEIDPVRELNGCYLNSDYSRHSDSSRHHHHSSYHSDVSSYHRSHENSERHHKRDWEDVSSLDGLEDEFEAATPLQSVRRF